MAPTGDTGGGEGHIPGSYLVTSLLFFLATAGYRGSPGPTPAGWAGTRAEGRVRPEPRPQRKARAPSSAGGGAR